MSPKLTTYRRPSIAAMIATAPNVLALAALREELSRSFGRGEISPSAGTVREWHVCLWARVMQLMIERPEDAPWIKNTVMGWECPDSLRDGLNAMYREIMAGLPSEAERLLSKGIVIKGVTG